MCRWFWVNANQSPDRYLNRNDEGISATQHHHPGHLILVLLNDLTELVKIDHHTVVQSDDLIIHKDSGFFRWRIIRKSISDKGNPHRDEFRSFMFDQFADCVIRNHNLHGFAITDHLDGCSLLQDEGLGDVHKRLYNNIIN